MNVKKGTATIATFTYDGDGKRVKAVEGSTTTLFFGAHYEYNDTTNQVTKYYLAGTTRIAMRKYTIPQPMKVEYFVGDHLGSTSLTTDSSGAKVSEIRYKPCPYRVLREGETRYSWTNDTQTTTPTYQLTPYRFTGQFSYEASFGLLYYGARFYDSSLGRFVQADTIIPESQGTQAWDRYAYVNNSPVNATDPTGHTRVEDPGGQIGCSDPTYCKKPPVKTGGGESCTNCHQTKLATSTNSSNSAITLPGITVASTCTNTFNPGKLLGASCGGSGGLMEYGNSDVGPDGDCTSSGSATVCSPSGGSVPLRYTASYDVQIYENMMVVTLYESYWIPPATLPLMDTSTFGSSSLIAISQNGQQTQSYLGNFTPGNPATPSNLISRSTRINYLGSGNYPKQLIIRLLFGSDNGATTIDYQLP